MYQGMAKRGLALILAFCMAGGTPGNALAARRAESAGVQAFAAGEAGSTMEEENPGEGIAGKEAVSSYAEAPVTAPNPTCSIETDAVFPDKVKEFYNALTLECAYNGNPITFAEPDQLAWSGTGNLVKGTDYKIEYANNVNPGKGSIRVIGMGSYSGEIDLTFTIWRDISLIADSDIHFEADWPYTGKAIRPVPEVFDGERKLMEGVHYAIGYPDADYTAKGQNRKIELSGDGTYYRGKKTVLFNIVRRELSGLTAEFAAPGTDNTYTYSGSDYQFGTGNFIKVKDANGTEISLDEFDCTTYKIVDGSAITPDNCRDIGSYQIQIQPKSAKADNYDYSGDSMIRLDYTVEAKPLRDDDTQYQVELRLNGTQADSLPYAGDSYANGTDLEIRVLDMHRNTDGSYSETPTAGFQLTQGVDYTVSYPSVWHAGVSMLTIQGRGNYSGERTKNFRIDRRPITKDNVRITLDSNEFVYTGRPIEPAITAFTVDGRTLTAEEIIDEFIIEMADPDSIGTGTGRTFKITGKKNYSGSLNSGEIGVTFSIKAKDINSMDVEVAPILNQAYVAGTSAKPQPEITYNGILLQNGTDYDLAWGNNGNKDTLDTPDADRPYVTITGKGNFSGSRKEIFKIRESLAGAAVSGLDNISKPYTSRGIEPYPVSVVLGGKTLVPASENSDGVLEGDYQVTWKNNIDAANASAANPPTIVISGINNYGGSIEKKFTITPMELGLASAGVLKAPLAIRPRLASSVEFTGSFVAPALSMVYDVKAENGSTLFTYTLRDGIDYMLVRSDNNINASTTKRSLTIGLVGIRNFRNSYVSNLTVADYMITAKPLTSGDIVIDNITVDPSMLTTFPVNPPVKITDTKRGDDGKYAVDGNGTYRLKSQAEAGENADYAVTYRNNTTPGTATVTITGRGNYKGTVTKTYLIPGNLAGAQITFTGAINGGRDYWYTGRAITPQIKVEEMNGSVRRELRRGRDYDLAFGPGDRINCGKYSIILTGKGAYASEGPPRVVEFSIIQVPVTDSKIKINAAASIQYQGGVNTWPGDDTDANKGALTILLGNYPLQKGRDYVLEPEDSCWQSFDIIKRKYTLKIQGINNFTGSATVAYAIGNNFDVNIALSETQWVYTGAEITPDITVTDPKNGNAVLRRRTSAGDATADYDVSYSDNVNAGTVTVTVFGLGGETGYNTLYCGSKKTTFTIKKKNLADSDIQIADIPDAVYAAESIHPEPAVAWTGHPDLEKDVDFKYSYPAGGNKNVKDSCYVEILPVTAGGICNFERSAKKTFQIVPKNIELEDTAAGGHTYLPADDVTLEPIPSQIYTGEAIAPQLDLHWGSSPDRQVRLVYNKTNPQGGDYTFVWGADNTNVGSVDITIEGKNNYTGTLQSSFEIVKVKLSDVAIAYQDRPAGYEAGEWPWAGKAIEPVVKLTYLSTDRKTIEMNSPGQWGYELVYGPNILRGTMSGSIMLKTASGRSCEGEKTQRFAIVKRHITDPAVLVAGMAESYELAELLRDGPPKPVLTFTPDILTRYAMEEGRDYSITPTIPGRIGTGKITIAGTENFDRTKDLSFAVANDISKYIVQSPPPSLVPNRFVYNGSQQRPALNIEFTDNAIKNPSDPKKPNYTIAWGKDNTDECINAGEHEIYMRGASANGYSGETKFTYTIDPRPLSKITFAIAPVEYTGSDIAIGSLSVSAVDSEIDSSAQVDSSHYRITAIENNREVGTAVAVIEAAGGNYTDGGQPLRVEFSIVPAKIDSSPISCSVVTPCEYAEGGVMPEITLTDTRRNADGSAASGGAGTYRLEYGEDKDYTVSFDGERYPGTVQMTITGVGHYAGSLQKTVEIYGDFSKDYIRIDAIPAQQYTEGEASEPPVTVRIGERTLVLGTDYTVEYENNTERTDDPNNPAYAVIHPVSGTPYREDSENPKRAPFLITRDLAYAQLRLIDTEFTYTGNQVAPFVTVAFGDRILIPGEDYLVDYGRNTDVGIGTLAVYGTGGYDGQAELQFLIVPKNIVRCEFGNIKDKIYAGTPVTQEPVVTDDGRQLVPDQDYMVSYKGHTAPGIAELTISGINNYSGNKVIRYAVNLAPVTEIQALGEGNEVALSWKPVPGAQGYTIYDTQNQVIAKTSELYYHHTGLDAYTVYGYKIRPFVMSGGIAFYGSFSNVVQAAPSIAKPVIKLKSLKRKIKVSWKRLGGVDGYEIYRSLSRKKGYAKIRIANKSVITSYTNGRLAKGQKYFYRIRAYKTVDGRKVYSSYSSPKAIKAK